MADSWADLPLFGATDEVPKLSEGEVVPEGVSDSMAILSHLMHDDETPEERSDLLRDKGNRNFRIGSRHALKRAAEEYTAALEVEGIPAQAKSLCFANRAAAEAKLGNFGRALSDAKMAMKLDSTNVKAFWRAAHSANRIGRWDEALDLALSGLHLMETGSASAKLLENEKAKAKAGAQKAKEREMRAQERASERESDAQLLSRALATRGIQRGPPLYAQQRHHASKQPVLAEDGSLTYPVLFVYPEVAEDDDAPQSDYVEFFHEDDSIENHLEIMLPPPWDASGRFAPGRVEALYRVDWTLSPAEIERLEALGTPVDRHYVGSERGPEEVGAWVSAPLDQPLCKVREEVRSTTEPRWLGSISQRALARSLKNGRRPWRVFRVLSLSVVFPYTFLSLCGLSGVLLYGLGRSHVLFVGDGKQIVSRADYVVPMFPVFYIVPTGFRPP